MAKDAVLVKSPCYEMCTLFGLSEGWGTPPPSDPATTLGDTQGGILLFPQLFIVLYNNSPHADGLDPPALPRTNLFVVSVFVLFCYLLVAGLKEWWMVNPREIKTV